MERSPYFGRFDFTQAGRDEAEAIYIGVYHYEDDEGNRLVHNWRAPIATMFYDYELVDRRTVARDRQTAFRWGRENG